ncbi:MAG: DUF1349 domain-containing protein, partial [Anaerolineae bacterium]
MKKLIMLVGVVLLILSAIAGTTNGAVAASATPFQIAWTDGFDSTTLDSRWTWVRENPSLWSLTDNPGSMRIISSGGLHETNNNQENILLTRPPAGDFRITTRVSVSPTVNYHGASLYVYQDDDNYLEVSRVYADGQTVRLKEEIGGVTSSWYWDTPATDLYLRIVKEGDDYYSFFSPDGDTWTFTGQINDLPLSDLWVGVGAHMGPDPVSVTADFDLFTLERIVYNAGWTEDFASPTLDGRWTWVRENPALWSLTDNPGYLRIVASGSLYQNDQENLLLTPAPAGDFSVTT